MILDEVYIPKKMLPHGFEKPDFADWILTIDCYLLIRLLNGTGSLINVNFMMYSMNCMVTHIYIGMLVCYVMAELLNCCNVLLLGREELSKIDVFPIIYVLKATDRHFEDNNWNLRAICYLLWALRCSLLNFLIFFLGNQSHLMYFIRFRNLTLYHEFFFFFLSLQP